MLNDITKNILLNNIINGDTIENYKNTIILYDKFKLIYTLCCDILKLNKWDKYQYYSKLCIELFNILLTYIDNKNIDNCIHDLQYIKNKKNLNNIYINFKYNCLDILSKNKKIKFFNDYHILLDIMNISGRNFGHGEIFFTLFTNCYKGKVVDLFFIDEKNKQYKQIELKGKEGRIGSGNHLRNFIDGHIIDNMSDALIIKNIINNIKHIKNINEKTEILYNFRSEFKSINKEYFKEQIKSILNEFEDIDYVKLILSIQIYSYCNILTADYLILQNKLDVCCIKINCLWDIYMQLLGIKLKINFNFADRKGFSITYLPLNK